MQSAETDALRFGLMGLYTAQQLALVDLLDLMAQFEFPELAPNGDIVCYLVEHSRRPSSRKILHRARFILEVFLKVT